MNLNSRKPTGYSRHRARTKQTENTTGAHRLQIIQLILQLILQLIHNPAEGYQVSKIRFSIIRAQVCFRYYSVSGTALFT
ncbi:predicted protein [Methanosarcina acetivorans C2A]|uniref:Uncharacterized protein n=1 Tax=Methanosarcina acetivorans (strain ATCC 35395 / DSM 2834 / JCM 12185 / C2A) TaxID=188937 RepID=Q8TQF9_METAC|nr:predicted protein [Methanosarcina acetivorans C2A]